VNAREFVVSASSWFIGHFKSGDVPAIDVGESVLLRQIAHCENLAGLLHRIWICCDGDNGSSDVLRRFGEVEVVLVSNGLKSSGDALYILLSVGIGLASGIGAVELALVMSLAFNYCFVGLWVSEYGEREGMKRYMSDFNPDSGPAKTASVEPPLPPGPAA